MEKFSQLSINHKAYEICFYWSNINGIETLNDLYNWESRDHSNRKLFKVSDHKEAETITNSKKLINQYL